MQCREQHSRLHGAATTSLGTADLTCGREREPHPARGGPEVPPGLRPQQQRRGAVAVQQCDAEHPCEAPRHPRRLRWRRHGRCGLRLRTAPPKWI